MGKSLEDGSAVLPTSPATGRALPCHCPHRWRANLERMRTVRVTAVLATTHLVPKYDGVRLSPEALREMVERVASGSLPMVWNHDPRRELAPSNVVANIENGTTANSQQSSNSISTRASGRS